MQRLALRFVVIGLTCLMSTLVHAAVQTCSSSVAFVIPDTNTWVSQAPGACSGSNVGFVRKVTLTVTFTHPRPSDLHFLVLFSTAPYFSRSAWVMGAAGGNSSFTGTITLDDDSALALPSGSALTNGQTYKPARYDLTVPPPPAAASFGSELFALNGSTVPSVSLYALDHISGSSGQVTSWSMSIDYTAAPFAGGSGYAFPTVVWQNSTLGQVQTWALNPLGPGLQFTNSYSVNGAWHVGPSGDYNGDGWGDFVWINDATHDLQVWLMSLGSITGTRSYNVAPPWQLVGTGHFYSRDIWDLVWLNPTAGVMQIWFMDNGNVAGTQNYSVGAGWTVTNVGDFDGRGRHDLVWRGPGGARQIWYMDGPAIKDAVAFTEPLTWDIGGIGDLDGDGRDDMIWINNSVGQGQIWLMNGDPIEQIGGVVYGITAYNFTLPAAPWTLINVQPYRVTGKAHLLWYNPSINTIQVWKMDGGAVVGAENFSAGVGWTPH